MPIVVSWWGPDPMPNQHILADAEVNSMVCHEDTVMPMGWIKFLLNNLQPNLAMDVYSTSGKWVHIIANKGIHFLNIFR